MITGQSSPVNPVYETGFVFSRVKPGSLGDVSPDYLLYPTSLCLRKYGNIDLSALTDDDVFVSSALAGSFEARGLEGLWSFRLDAQAIRREIQPDRVPKDLWGIATI